MMNDSIKPRFFKVILVDATNMEKLVIPSKFVSKYGKELPDSVVLKTPNGTSWRVDVTKSGDDGEIWLGKGWQEFAKYYCLKHGHFLVFEYEMKSCFSVFIFDVTATEIDYPNNKVNDENVDGENPKVDGNNEVVEIGETESDASVEILDDFGANEDQSRSLLERPHKRKRTNLAFQPRSISSSSSCNSVSLDYTSRSWKVSGRRPLIHVEKKEAIQRASAGFVSENPFFMVAMQPSYLNRTEVRISSQFVKKHLPKSHSSQVIFQVEGGRSWIMGLNVRRPSFDTNWREFARDNNLKTGDVVIFELIDDKKLVFNVIISKTTEDFENDEPPIEKHIEAANRFTPENPFFKAEITSHNLSGVGVYLPRKFIKDHVKRSQNIDLQVAYRLWPMKLNVHSLYRATFSEGWDAFVKENDLQVGDACVYDLTQKDPMIIRVSMFKRAR